MKEGLKVVPVITVESIVGSYPDAAIAVLAYIGNQSTGKMLGRYEMTRLCNSHSILYDTNEKQ